MDLNDRANFQQEGYQRPLPQQIEGMLEASYHLRQTKYWIDDPGSIGNATACLDCLALSTVLQALTSHNYLNYHHYIVGKFSEQICWFKEECKEFIHLMCECPALAMECLGSV